MITCAWLNARRYSTCHLYGLIHLYRRLNKVKHELKCGKLSVNSRQSWINFGTVGSYQLTHVMRWTCCSRPCFKEPSFSFSSSEVRRLRLIVNTNEQILLIVRWPIMNRWTRARGGAVDRELLDMRQNGRTAAASEEFRASRLSMHEVLARSSARFKFLAKRNYFFVRIWIMRLNWRQLESLTSIILVVKKHSL